MDPIISIMEPAPLFSLPGFNSAVYRLEEQRGRIVILDFWSAECPWSERADHQLLAFLSAWGEAVSLWPIASNANEPTDLLKGVSRLHGLPDVLRDEGQHVANLYGAQTTPHLFVVDAQGLLRYQGALDDVTFRQRTPTRHYLRDAVEALLSGNQPEPDFTRPYGCAITRYNP